MGSEILPSSRSSAKPFCLAYCEETRCQQICVYILAFLDEVVLVVRLWVFGIRDTTNMDMTYLVGYKVLVVITDLEVQTELPHERPRV